MVMRKKEVAFISKVQVQVVGFCKFCGHAVQASILREVKTDSDEIETVDPFDV